MPKHSIPLRVSELTATVVRAAEAWRSAGDVAVADDGEPIADN